MQKLLFVGSGAFIGGCLRYLVSLHSQKLLGTQLPYGTLIVNVIGDEKMSNLRLKKMGFIFQQPHLLKTLSIRDNIVLPGFKAKSEKGFRKPKFVQGKK